MFRCCLRGLCSGSVRNMLTAMWYLLALSGLGLSYVLLPSGPALAQWSYPGSVDGELLSRSSLHRRRGGY